MFLDVICKTLCLSWGHRHYLLVCDVCLVVVYLLSCVWLSETPWTAACQASLSFTISQSLFKFMSTESVMLSKQLILYPFAFLLFSFNLSQSQGLFHCVSSSPMSQLFVSGGQNIGASTSAPVLPVNIQGWFPLGLTALISLHNYWKNLWLYGPLSAR